jgi:hypothetical protein
MWAASERVRQDEEGPGMHGPWVVAVLAAIVLTSPVRAAEDSDTALAKQTQNPVADLISVPFQHNFNFNTGPENRTVWIMNVQPVVPIKLSDSWNLITRTIMPIINQPSLAPGIDHAFGLGDINPSLFLSPAGSEKFIWRAGPTFTFPTATSRELGSGKWSAGPTAVAPRCRDRGWSGCWRTISGRSPAGVTTT